MPSKPPLRITSVARGPFDAGSGVSEGELCPRGSDIARAVSAAVELRLSRALPGPQGAQSRRCSRAGRDIRTRSWSSRRQSATATPGWSADLCEHQAPGVDDERAAVARARLVVATPLCGRKHERLIFDRTGAEQDFPVILACVGRKGAGNREPPCAPCGEVPIEFWKTQVVTDRKAKGPERRLRENDLFARCNRRRLGVAGTACLAQVHVEQMNLPVDSRNLAGVRERGRSYSRPARPRRFLRESFPRQSTCDAHALRLAARSRSHRPAFVRTGSGRPRDAGRRNSQASQRAERRGTRPPRGGCGPRRGSTPRRRSRSSGSRPRGQTA